MDNIQQRIEIYEHELDRLRHNLDNVSVEINTLEWKRHDILKDIQKYQDELRAAQDALSNRA